MGQAEREGRGRWGEEAVRPLRHTQRTVTAPPVAAAAAAAVGAEADEMSVGVAAAAAMGD